MEKRSASRGAHDLPRSLILALILFLPTCGSCTVVMVITMRFCCAHGARVGFILFSFISSSRPFIIEEIGQNSLDRQEGPEYTPNNRVICLSLVYNIQVEAWSIISRTSSAEGVK
jgi:hypothetical protein